MRITGLTHDRLSGPYGTVLRRVCDHHLIVTNVPAFAEQHVVRDAPPCSACDERSQLVEDGPGLYGARMLRSMLLAAGERMRVYLPYGTQWYGYFMRRLAERPANVAFFLRALASRG